MTRLKDQVERDGGSLSFMGYTEAARLFGQMTGVRHASENLSKAAATDAILWEHIGLLPYGNNPSLHGGPRTFDVRVNYQAIRSGVEGPDYVTLRYTGGLPLTVGELRQEAMDISQSLAEGYGSSFLGMSSIEIGEL
jgi:hypothetical protein